MDNVVNSDGCVPDAPAPQQNEPEYCHGTIKMECCCPRLYTRTFIVPIGPQTEPQVTTFLGNTVTSYESNGYLVMAHGLVDVGAGWLLTLTIGWYA